jgi:hypothetical protein
MIDLLHHDGLDPDETAYRIFGLGRDNKPWRAAEVLRMGERTRDEALAARAWKMSSGGYYAEQAGLVAALTLAADTEDAALRFSLATAASDEARHADAFHQYARMAGGRVQEQKELFEPLHEGLTALPYLGKALVHTMLEGFAADEFILLSELFGDDPLAHLYRYVRRDEIRHVAIGLNYLARATTAAATRDEWTANGSHWLEVGMGLTGLEGIARGLAALIGREPDAVHHWFLRRHDARMVAAGVVTPSRQGGDQS